MSTKTPENPPVTYAENEAEKPFDWNEFLNKRSKGEPTGIHDAVASFNAASWVTCACGNQCAMIPRDPMLGNPIDKVLRNLGIDFSEQIDAQDWDGAKSTLARIESRSSFLLAQMSLPAPEENRGKVKAERGPNEVEASAHTEGGEHRANEGENEENQGERHIQ